MKEMEKTKYNSHFEIIPSAKSQNEKNNRGNSVPEKNNKTKNNAISNIITQEQAKPMHHQPHVHHLNNERPFSLSPNRITNDKLLPNKPESSPSKTLVLDLDETLVHSSFQPFLNSDIILKVEFEGKIYDIHVLIRPGVEEFIYKMSKLYEIVVFTASLSKYAEPLLDILDQKKNISYRLFREHCTCINGVYVKDLKKINRELKDTIIVDNSPVAYAFNPENGFPIKSWYEDKEDKELYLMAPILEFLSIVDDVRHAIPQMVMCSELSYAKAHSLMNELASKRDTNKNGSKENNDVTESKTLNDKTVKKKTMQISVGPNLKKEETNIRLVNYSSKDNHNNDAQSLFKEKESLTTKNKLNTFKLSNCKNDFFCLNQINLNTKKNQIIERMNANNQTKKNNFMQSIKFNYLQNEKEKEKEKSLQYFKLKIGKYTNLMGKKESDHANINSKLRPSSSAGILRNNNDNESKKKLVINPSTLNTINNASLANYSVYKPQYTKNIRNDQGKKTNIFKGFPSETPTSFYSALSPQSNSLQSFSKKLNMANTTRNNSNNTHQGLKLSK